MRTKCAIHGILANKTDNVGNIHIFVYISMASFTCKALVKLGFNPGAIRAAE